MSEWQPIETAPKDGTKFIAFVPIKNHRLMICQYLKIGILVQENCMPPQWPVTHWMTLPEPPKQS